MRAQKSFLLTKNRQQCNDGKVTFSISLGNSFFPTAQSTQERERRRRIAEQFLMVAEEPEGELNSSEKLVNNSKCFFSLHLMGFVEESKVLWITMRCDADEEEAL